MALTADIIKQNQVLATLTPEQISAIETLSTNDEATVLGTRIGEIYREMDGKIAAITGVQRNGDEKTYLYLERAAKSLKDQAGEVATIKKQVEDLTKEKTKLEKAIADGTADAEAAKQLKQLRAELDQTKGQYNTLQKELDDAKTAHTKELFDVRIDNELRQASAGLKFKAEIPQSATDTLLQQTISKLKGSYKPDYIDDGNGGQRLVFRNEAGAVMNNPENQLNPYTASELLAKELKTMGILDEARKQTGAGTGAGAGSGTGAGSTVDISGARTKVEATEMATKAILAQGITKGSAEFDAAMTQAWKDHNVTSLPEK